MIESQRESFFNTAYCSDNEDFVEQTVNTKRQKMTEGERLTRCRERNRLHAKSTRERKKSHMDCLENRIEELVDKKKRLNSTASMTSVASILMSLSSIEKHAGIAGINFNGPEVAESDTPPFKVESDDDTSESVEKLKKKISSLLNNEDYKSVMDLAMNITKDKVSCSTSELEGVRREKNRMHAKQTRLKKKKMTQEMEVIISTLEKEVGDLQSGLISLLPLPTAQNTQSTSNNSSLMDYAKNFMSRNQTLPSDVKQFTGYLQDQETPLSGSSSYRKRKYASPLEISSQKAAAAGSQQESVKEVQGQGDRDTKLMWRQHISKNPLKTVSVCSESIGSLSEGSGNEGESAGSAVHSLLHMGDSSRDSSSPNRGSTSGSDESDTASSKHTSQTSQIVQAIVHNQSRLQTQRVAEKAIPLPTPLHMSHKPFTPFTYPYERPKSIQAILSACGPPLQVMRKQPQQHWRLPERSASHFSHSLAGPTAAAVASIYPTIAIEYGNSGPFKGYLPMNCAFESQSSVLDTRMRSHDFTVYDGYKSRSPREL